MWVVANSLLSEKVAIAQQTLLITATGDRMTYEHFLGILRPSNRHFDKVHLLGCYKTKK